MQEARASTRLRVTDHAFQVRSLVGEPRNDDRLVTKVAGLFEVGRLSGGWQRRVNIAVALMHSPEVLILDEPTAAVDAEARPELWRLIEMRKDSGVTILLTSHHLDEVERRCNSIGIMNNGRNGIARPQAARTDWQRPAGGVGNGVSSPTRGSGHRSLTQHKRSPGFPKWCRLRFLRAGVSEVKRICFRPEFHGATPLGDKQCSADYQLEIQLKEVVI